MAAALTAGLTLRLDRLAPRRGWLREGGSVCSNSHSFSIYCMSRLSVSLFFSLCYRASLMKPLVLWAAAPCLSCHWHTPHKPPPPFLKKIKTWTVFSPDSDCPPIYIWMLHNGGNIQLRNNLLSSFYSHFDSASSHATRRGILKAVCVEQLRQSLFSFCACQSFSLMLFRETWNKYCVTS
jgi:hypothetical protein